MFIGLLLFAESNVLDALPEAARQIDVQTVVWLFLESSVFRFKVKFVKFCQITQMLIDLIPIV